MIKSSPDTLVPSQNEIKQNCKYMRTPSLTADDIQRLRTTPLYRHLTSEETQFLFSDDPYLSHSPWKALVWRPEVEEDVLVTKGDMLLELLWLQDCLLYGLPPEGPLPYRIEQDFLDLTPGATDVQEETILRLAQGFVDEAFMPMLDMWSRASREHWTYIREKALQWGINRNRLPDGSDRWIFKDEGSPDNAFRPTKDWPSYAVWCGRYLRRLFRSGGLSLVIRSLMEDYDAQKISPPYWHFVRMEDKHWGGGESIPPPVSQIRREKEEALKAEAVRLSQIDPDKEWQRRWAETPYGLLLRARKNPLEGLSFQSPLPPPPEADLLPPIDVPLPLARGLFQRWPPYVRHWKEVLHRIRERSEYLEEHSNTTHERPPITLRPEKELPSPHPLPQPEEAFEKLVEANRAVTIGGLHLPLKETDWRSGAPTLEAVLNRLSEASDDMPPLFLRDGKQGTPAFRYNPDVAIQRVSEEVLKDEGGQEVHWKMKNGQDGSTTAYRFFTPRGNTKSAMSPVVRLALWYAIASLLLTDCPWPAARTDYQKLLRRLTTAKKDGKDEQGNSIKTDTWLNLLLFTPSPENSKSPWAQFYGNYMKEGKMPYFTAIAWYVRRRLRPLLP